MATQHTGQIVIDVAFAKEKKKFAVWDDEKKLWKWNGKFLIPEWLPENKPNYTIMPDVVCHAQ